MRKDKSFEGVLLEFDLHGNVFMSDCTETSQGGVKFEVGDAVINGGNVAMIEILQ